MRTGGFAVTASRPFKRQQQVRCPLVSRNRVDFIDDHCFHVAQDAAALFGGQQDVERFRRGDQDVRRPSQHLLAFMHQRIAGANRGADLWHQQSAFDPRAERSRRAVLPDFSECRYREP